MTIIYLKHPVHGEKVASLEAEAKHDEARGWKRFDPSMPVAPSPNPIAVAQPFATGVLVVSSDALKRRGRPPKSE